MGMFSMIGTLTDPTEKLLNNKVEGKLHSFLMEQNKFLKCDIQAYHRTYYVGYQQPNNPDYINTLKNTYNNTASHALRNAMKKLVDGLDNEIIEIIKKFPKDAPIAICTVPRAKSESFYSPQQLYFSGIIGLAIQYINKKHNINIIDGTKFIVRHTNTKTTHLKRDTPNYDNSGPEPYPGIANDTCFFSDEIKNKHILLIDDVYTKTINIDEDFIQSLLDRECKSVKFFAIAYTQRNNLHNISNDDFSEILKQLENLTFSEKK